MDPGQVENEAMALVLDREKLEPIFASDVLFGSRKRMNLLRLIAAIGMMVGYRVGQLVWRLVRASPKRFLSLSVGAVLCFYFALAYSGTIQMGSANTSDIVNLGALLGLCFLSLGFLLPFTRVLVPNEIEILWSRAIEYFARLFRG